MLKNKLIARIVLFAAIVMIIFSGCAKSSEQQSGSLMKFASFRDIPGITDEEIKAIEALQKQNISFVYGMVPSTEAFLDENGEISGYAVLLCDWLSGLFDMHFQVKLFEWGDLIARLNSGKVDFTGEMKATDERRKIYYMTDPIAERMVKSMRIKGSEELSKIAVSRPLRYAMFEGAVTVKDVAGVLEGGSYEAVLVNNYEAIYRMLTAGKIDAFVSESVVEAAFDIYGDIYVEDFLPMIVNSSSIATANPAFEPVISLLTKALRNGGIHYLNEKYNLGYSNYRKHKFFALLNEKEKEYLRNISVVPYAACHWYYPISYYNDYEKKWDGIAFDILKEVENLTGLVFEVVHDKYTKWPTMLEMLRDGRAHIISDLIITEERKAHFIWSKYGYVSSRHALLSKQNFPEISIGEIPYAKIALIKGTGYVELFHNLFPNAVNVREYGTIDDAFYAVERGEVDLVMASTVGLSCMTNYYEFSSYKANFLFNHTFGYNFGFNKEQTVLCSIVDKALSLIETDRIVEQWTTKTYDYESMLLRAQRPWLYGAIALSLIILALVSVQLVRSRNTGKQLEELVNLRTSELQLRTEEALSASRSKSAFLANMNHEMRTPMNVVVGLTDLMLEEDDPSVNLKKNLEKISTAGNTLLSLINDVLDFSKIEAGKLELMPVQYELSSLLNDIVTLNMLRIEDKPIVFLLDIDKDLPYSLYGDDLRIKQIINNLLSNAFKYTQKGRVTLGMNCEHENGENMQMSVYVSDTGIGIREEDMKKLFTDYNQVDTRTNRSIMGTGLGLSIAKMLVEHMDGEISVESEYGKGATFSFHVRQQFVSDAVIGAETAENLRGFRYLENKRIDGKKLIRPDLSYAKALVVDDMQANLDVATGLLGKYKMQVDCVNSGQEAVDLIERGEPVYDVIFMDHMMPGMDGVETAAKIRAIGTKYAMMIPIIALTANAVAGNEQMFLEKDFQAFLAKPINIMNLDVIVQRWVRDKSRE